jgi:hypothetical protein
MGMMDWALRKFAEGCEVVLRKLDKWEAEMRITTVDLSEKESRLLLDVLNADNMTPVYSDHELVMLRELRTKFAAATEAALQLRRGGVSAPVVEAQAHWADCDMNHGGTSCDMGCASTEEDGETSK